MLSVPQLIVSTDTRTKLALRRAGHESREVNERTPQTRWMELDQRATTYSSFTRDKSVVAHLARLAPRAGQASSSVTKACAHSPHVIHSVPHFM